MTRSTPSPPAVSALPVRTAASGRSNQALRFDGGVADDDGNDGVADFLTINATDTELGLVDNNFTVAAWVKPDTSTRSAASLCRRAGNDDTLATAMGLVLACRMATPGSSPMASRTMCNRCQRTDRGLVPCGRGVGCQQ
ncbi:MAG: hypothetical protein R2932_29920 [Caldilineaceae bacterium]